MKRTAYMGSRPIRISNRVAQWIRENSRPGDTPDAVLRRLLDLPPKVRRKPGPKPSVP